MPGDDLITQFEDQNSTTGESNNSSGLTDDQASVLL